MSVTGKIVITLFLGTLLLSTSMGASNKAKENTRLVLGPSYCPGLDILQYQKKRKKLGLGI